MKVSKEGDKGRTSESSGRFPLAFDRISVGALFFSDGLEELKGTPVEELSA